MEPMLIGLIWLLIYALAIALVCYIVVRLITMFVAAFAPFGWIVWCIGGLLLLILALRLFAPMLGG